MNNNTRMLFILRGLPGSGKSTLAKVIIEQAKEEDVGYTIHSTDDLHYETNPSTGIRTYVFKANKLRGYHAKNLFLANQSMSNGTPIVIIDNTNTTWGEILPYAEAAKKHGYNIIIQEPVTSWAKDAAICATRNIHGVPLEAINRMLARYESSECIASKLKQLNQTF